MKLKFKVRDVYGRALYYPDNENAKIITDIMHRETLTKAQISYLEKLEDAEIIYEPALREKNYGYMD